MHIIISRYLHQLQLCVKRKAPSIANTLHAQIIKIGLHQCGPLPNTLLDAYGKCGQNEDAVQMFEEMPQRDYVSWASILTAYNQANLPGKTLSVFPSMFVLDRLQPDHFVFASLVKACSSLGALRQGQQVHARFFLSPFSEDDVVKSSLVDMYAKCGLPDIARLVFDSISAKNPVSWTAMISGYSRSGRKAEAISLFSGAPVRNLFSWTALISGFVQSGNGIDASNLFIEMRREGVDIVDPLVLSSVIGACANLATTGLGKQIHGLVIALGFESCLFISNALVDMYAKCSDIAAANCIFDCIQRRDVVSWTSIIVGAAQHGRAEEALARYKDMISAGIKPNEVTFVGLIYACSHSGLVGKGRELFKSMKEDYGIRPSLQHYTCLLDLLSRSGHLDEAHNLIKSMPFEPDEPTWAALLSACKHHGKIQMGIKVADHLLSLKPVDPSTYILLSNVYAGAAKWESVSKVRKLIEVMEIKKEPGYSCIDLGKEHQVFHAGETSHPMKEEIFGLLKELEAEMRKRGYVPDTSFVLHDMEEQEKERQLFWHSERLALAYGLLNAVPGTVIRIVKNVRVCGDCHNVLKFVSDIVKREIVVRDATRYHHFREGRCSCSEFW
ncbi:pentatricopeptide repeat-containing protein At4g14050, mitochondrial-like [Tripterygium wilfordii]|uniref:pentatricopeptide repeat-containing protein At4g14050, mitochondrial-like n=1 Tax=Tripterygium wilfordii TaxID=458696 RepID=UPI0018F80345|nr:pentatricopeptide repeat-containing protein At4g14050, mitochondrial-like [Tripterygium wilfordii]XP_038697218.1 pentatricopeptide repeat-containing protein At4g14050, mitochondrial-like [Tripterygium wilfordii]XP_038697219.1 pentatricopeptide repeat-containing protein At4g14050, mitochondrial-like [Tripterygium wilfordii]XP_038697220.1 pentatricopeptide repeat-containing protein At4g14050, mitochondrial-like [Tripterygium wilfordii]XP_038697221.1 pentatricopeptide repeat-containing protein 